MAKSMSFDRVGRAFIAVIGAKTAAPSDWNAFIAALEAHLSEVSSLLVFSAGASIDIREREQLERLLTRGRLRVAVLTDSKVLRGAVTALSWFKIPIKSFAANNVEAALDHIRVHKSDRAHVYTSLAQLKALVP